MDKDIARMCSSCDEVIMNDSFMKCSNKRCKKLYEIECLSIQQEQFDKFTQEYKEVWVCPDCVFAHFACIKLNNLFGLPGPNNYTVASQDSHNQARVEHKEEDESKFRANIMSRFDKIETQCSSLPNIFIEELCYLNKAGQNDLYTRIRNLEEKMTSNDNKLMSHLNHITSRVMLLENFMPTIQRQLNKMEFNQSEIKASSVSGNRSNEVTSPKKKDSETSETGAAGPGEELQKEEAAAAVEIVDGKKDKKKEGKQQLENWSMHIL